MMRESQIAPRSPGRRKDRAPGVVPCPARSIDRPPGVSDAATPTYELALLKPSVGPERSGRGLPTDRNGGRPTGAAEREPAQEGGS